MKRKKEEKKKLKFKQNLKLLFYLFKIEYKEGK